MSWSKISTGLFGVIVLLAASSAALAGGGHHPTMSPTSGGGGSRPNFSNSSGANSSTSQGYRSTPNKTGVGRYNESITSRATQLNQSLTAAEQALVDAEYRASSRYNSIPRYGRTAIPDQVCLPSATALADVETAKANLAQAQSEANSFLASVSSPNSEQIQKVSECTSCSKGW
jgi:3-mercaptopyruvate sulfurtransferase SseA